jgi:SAM-dependent methyltransferase
MNSVTMSLFLGRKFRPKRLKVFAQLMSLSQQATVLDVGGATFDWNLCERLLGYRPRVTILNIERPIATEGLPWVAASGMELPFPDQSFDIVYTNSVIEHLYNAENQQRFAREVARVGKRYFVQAPNRWFPVEPHYLTPFIHYFPPRIQLKFLRNFTVWGLMSRPSGQLCQRNVEEIHLLDKRGMQQLLPSAEIIHERVCGLTKSFIAVQTPELRAI